MVRAEMLAFVAFRRKKKSSFSHHEVWDSSRSFTVAFYQFYQAEENFFYLRKSFLSIICWEFDLKKCMLGLSNVCSLSIELLV